MQAPVQGLCNGQVSICLSVPSFDSERRAAGLLLSAPRTGDLDRHSTVGAGAQQQRRRRTAHSSKCRQCHVDSRVDEAEHKLARSTALTRRILIVGSRQSF